MAMARLKDNFLTLEQISKLMELGWRWTHMFGAPKHKWSWCLFDTSGCVSHHQGGKRWRDDLSKIAKDSAKVEQQS